MSARVDREVLAAVETHAVPEVEVLNSERRGIHPLRHAVIGVLAHNEEPNIENCLRAILDEKIDGISVQEVVVVSSGCTDRTEDIIRALALRDGRLRLISEAGRTGKASALNLLLRHTTQPLVVVLGGDVVFTPGSLARLLEPLADPCVGMTGVRPIPTNPRHGVVGRVVHVLWDMHHELSLTRPKLGEAIAFRRVLDGIDTSTLVDEAMLEQTVKQAGLQLRYVPTAIVRNHGPETIREFMAQRTRIYRGHLQLAASTGYRVSSMDSMATGRAALKLLTRRDGAQYLAVALLLEAAARIRARWGVRTSEEMGVWAAIATSKVVVRNGHVLRAHHDCFNTVRLRYGDTGRLRRSDARALTSWVRRAIRREDKIRVGRQDLSVTLRGDEDAARSVSARLALEIRFAKRSEP